MNAVSNPARLKDKRIIVIGGASGIGRAVVEQALREGAQVGVLDRDEANVEEIAAIAKDATPPVSLRGDIADTAVPRRAIGELADRIGGLDGLLSAAGITRPASCLEFGLSEWNEVIGVNLTGTFLCAQAAANLMIAGGHAGSIVTVSSALAFTGQHSGVAYAASKAGLIGMMKTMAIELGANNIRCNDIAPGVVDTPLVRRTLPADYLAAWGSRTPMGRVGQPEELAPAACFLLSDESAWITGQTIHVNGGFIMA